MFDNRDRPIGLRRTSSNLTETGTDPEVHQPYHPEPFAPQPRPSFGVNQTSLSALQHPNETPLFFACVVISSLCYFAILAIFFMPLNLLGVIGITMALTIFSLIGQGFLTGYIKGNCIRVSTRQLPEVHQAVESFSVQLGIPMPPVYVLESGGLLNAFATRFLRKPYVVLFSDVVEMAYEQGPEALNFVVAHELAHIARKHLQHRWMIKPVEILVPILPQTYYRACEYSCDLIASHCAPLGAVGGLMALSAGKKLHHHVDANEFAAQVRTETGFWVWFAELFSTHPNLSKRVQTVMSLPVVQQASTLSHLHPKAGHDQDLVTG